MSDETKNPIAGTFFDSFSFQEPDPDKPVKTEEELKAEKDAADVEAAKVAADAVKAEADAKLSDEEKAEAKKLEEEAAAAEETTKEEFDSLATTLKDKKEEDLEDDEKEFLKNYEAGTLDEYKAKAPVEKDDEPAGFEALTKTLIEEGILAETEDVVDTQESLNKAINHTVETKVDEYLAEIPEDYKNVIEHMRAGGDVNSYLQSKATVDYKNLDLENVEIQKALVKADLEAQEYSADEVQEKIKDYEDLEKLKKEATKSSKKFDKEQTQRIKDYDKSITDALAAEDKAALKDINEVKKSIDGMKEIAGFKLTKKRKEDFKKYLFDVDESGHTAASKAQAENENRIKAHFMGFIGYKFEDLEKAVASKNVKNISQILSRYKDANTVSKGTEVKDTKPDPEFKLVIPSMFDRGTDE